MNERTTYDQVRSRRRRLVKARTIGMRLLLTKGGRVELPIVDDTGRPRTRGECDEVARPCPYVSCKYNLFLDVDQRRGSIKLNFPDLEPGDMTESCALDVADRGGATLEEAGAFTNVTRERIRQIYAKTSVRLKLRAHMMGLDLAELLADAPMRHDEVLDETADSGGAGDSKPDPVGDRNVARGGPSWSLRGEVGDGEFPPGTDDVACDRVWAAYAKRVFGEVPEDDATEEETTMATDTQTNEFVETIRAATKKLGKRASVHEIAAYAGDIGSSGWGQRISKLKLAGLVASSPSKKNGGIWVVGDDPSPDNSVDAKLREYVAPRKPKAKAIAAKATPSPAVTDVAAFVDTIAFLREERQRSVRRVQEFDDAIAALTSAER